MCALDQAAGANIPGRSTQTSWTVTEITSQIPSVPIKLAIQVSRVHVVDVERRGIKHRALA